MHAYACTLSCLCRIFRCRYIFSLWITTEGHLFVRSPLLLCMRGGRGRQEPPRKRICIMNEPGQPTGEGSFEMRKEAPCRASACLERASDGRFLRNKGGPPGRNRSPLEGERRRGDYEFIFVESQAAPSKQRAEGQEQNNYPFTYHTSLSDWIWKVCYVSMHGCRSRQAKLSVDHNFVCKEKD